MSTIHQEATVEATEEATQETQSLLFVGNTTTLIRYGGFTLLTDPNFLHRGQTPTSGTGWCPVAARSRRARWRSSRSWTWSCCRTCTVTIGTG